MKNIIKLDLIKLKKNIVNNEQLSQNENLFLSLGKYDYFQIQKHKYEDFSSILHLNNLNKDSFENCYCSSCYLCDPVIENTNFNDLLNKSYCILSFLDGPDLTQELIDKLNEMIIENIQFQIYTVLNGFKYILIASSNKYLPFTKLILTIRKMMSTKDSKSVFDSSYSIIGLKKLSGFEEENIPKITIHTKLNTAIKREEIAKYIEDYYEETGNKEKIGKYDHIGNSDCYFTFENIEINKFLNLYLDFFIKNLNNNKDYFAFLDTKFSSVMDSKDEINLIEVEDINIKKYENLELKKNILLKSINNIKDKIELYGKIYYYNIINIIDAISKVDKTRRYEVAYEMILEALIKFVENLSKYEADELNELVSEDDFCLICNASNQILETINYSRNNLSLEQYNLNESVYNFPHRFLDFYNRFTKAILLSFHDKSLYNFLIIPCLTNEITIIQIFKDNSPTDKILLINVPVNLLYKPDVLCPMLIHDIGHFCGQDIRKREIRKNRIIKSISTIYYLRLINRVDVKVAVSDGLGEKLFDEFADNLKNRYIKFSQECAYSTHRDYLQPFITKHIRNYLIESQEKIINRIMVSLVKNNLSIEEVREQLNIIKNNINDMISYEVENDDLLTDVQNIKSNVDELFNLYYEGFADCLAMSVLEIDINDLRKCFKMKGSGKSIKKENNLEYDLEDIRLLIQDPIKAKPDEDTVFDGVAEYLIDQKMYDSIRIPDVKADFKEYIQECKTAIESEIEKNQESNSTIKISDIRLIFQTLKEQKDNVSFIIKELDNFVDKINKIEYTRDGGKEV